MVKTVFPGACPVCGKAVVAEFYTEPRYASDKAEPGRLNAELICADEDCSYNPVLLDMPIYEMLREFRMISAPHIE